MLLVASLVFYMWGEARYVRLILASVAFNWWIGIAHRGRHRSRAPQRWLTAAVAANLLRSRSSSTRTSRSRT